MTRSAELSSILIGAADSIGTSTKFAAMMAPAPVRSRLRFSMADLPSRLAQQIRSCVSRKAEGSARLDAVAHRAETCKCRRPVVARGAGDDPEHVAAAAEPQPLHHRNRCIGL